MKQRIKKTTSKSKTLSIKEKGFVQDIAKGKSGVEAALNNYDTEDYSTAGAIASENLKKPKIVKALADAFPDELLQEKHLELLNAFHLEHISLPSYKKDKKSTKKKKGKKGIEYGYETSDAEIIKLFKESGCQVKKIIHGYLTREVYYWSPDTMARDRALDKAYKIKGSYAAEKKELTGANGEPLFNDEHRTKAKNAIGGYLAGNIG